MQLPLPHVSQNIDLPDSPNIFCKGNEIYVGNITVYVTAIGVVGAGVQMIKLPHINKVNPYSRHYQKLPLLVGNPSHLQYRLSRSISSRYLGIDLLYRSMHRWITNIEG